MGAKPIFALRFSPRNLFKAALAGTLAVAVSSCISDGPNRTGGDYLAQNGVFLQDPLYHVTLKNIPVDTFWTSEAEPSHQGDSTILVGHTGDFTAESRVAFQFSDTLSLYNIDTKRPSTLKLSLSVPPWPAGLSNLHASVAGDPAHPRDSIFFEVRSWDFTKDSLTDDQWATKVAALNNQYWFRDDTLALLDTSKMIRDIISLPYDSAYVRHTPVARQLPNLHASLIKARGVKHVIQMRIVLANSKDDTTLRVDPLNDGMLRLGGYLGNTDGDYEFGPQLLLGDYDSVTVAPAANRITPMLLANNKTMVNYGLKYSGPKNNLVTTKVRGLHVILDRKTLLDSIDANLRLQGLPVQPRPASGDFDPSYFVPFAKIALPLDTVKSSFEGGYPLMMNMVTAMDTLLGDIVNGSLRVDTVLDGTARTLFHTYEVGHPNDIHDDVSVSYAISAKPPNQGIATVILKYSVDTLRNDTVYIKVGDSRQRSVLLVGYGPTRLNLEYQAGETFVLVRSYFSNRAEAENNEFRDPATGEPPIDLLTRLPHFLKPGQKALALRATDGFQRLLNRVQSNASVLQEFQFVPGGLSAVDPKNAADTTTAENKIPLVVQYPILSVVAPLFQGNSLKVDVELYLYPLKAR